MTAPLNRGEVSRLRRGMIECMDPAELERRMIALKSPYGDDSNDAARSLGRAAIASAIPALAAALCHDAAWEHTDSACVKAEAIATIGGEAAIATLVGLLLKYDLEAHEDANGDVSDKSWRVHHACVHGLVQIGRLAIPALHPLLQHTNRRAAQSAAEALEKLGAGDFRP